MPNRKQDAPSPEPIPTFATEAEEAEYWATTSSTKHFDPDDTSEEVQVEVALNRNLKGVYIRLPTELIDGLKAYAKGKGRPYQRVVRQWLLERLEQEQGRGLRNPQLDRMEAMLAKMQGYLSKTG